MLAKRGAAKAPPKKMIKKAAPEPPAQPAKKVLKKAAATEPTPSAKKPATDYGLPQPIPQADVPPPKNVKGKKFRQFPGAILVPVEEAPDHPWFKRMHKIMNVPNTYFKWEGGKITTLMSRMPNGLWLAWWNCGNCHAHILNCPCKAGISVCRGVEFIFDKITAEEKGEEWSTNHPHYYGSRSVAMRDARLMTSSKPVWVTDSPLDGIKAGRSKASRQKWGDDPIPLPAIGGKVADGSGKRLLRKAGAKPAPAPEPPRKKAITRTTGKSGDDILKNGGMDMEVLDREAQKDTEDLTAQALSKIAGTPVKATTAKKKIIRKR